MNCYDLELVNSLEPWILWILVGNSDVVGQRSVFVLNQNWEIGSSQICVSCEVEWVSWEQDFLEETRLVVGTSEIVIIVTGIVGWLTMELHPRALLSNVDGVELWSTLDVVFHYGIGVLCQVGFVFRVLNGEVCISTVTIHPFYIESLSWTNLEMWEFGQSWLAWIVSRSSWRARNGVNPIVSRSEGKTQENNHDGECSGAASKENGQSNECGDHSI